LRRPSYKATSDEGNAVDGVFSAACGRPLKTPQLQAQHHFPAQIIATSQIYQAESGAGEERRRAAKHAAVTSDEGNDVDGVFSAACWGATKATT